MISSTYIGSKHPKIEAVVFVPFVPPAVMQIYEWSRYSPGKTFPISGNRFIHIYKKK